MPLFPRYTTIDTAAVDSIAICCKGSYERLNSRYANLNLLPECTILHAELTWFASSEKMIIWPHEGLVNFETPAGGYQLRAHHSTNVIVPRGYVSHLICSTDITSMLKEWTSGAYSLSIPAKYNHSTIIQCGWSLNIVMKHPSLPLQFIQFVTGHEPVSKLHSHFWMLSGCSLPISNIKVKLWLCATNGQALLGEVGSYYSVRTRMKDFLSLPASTGLLQMELTNFQIIDPSFREQLICAISTTDPTVQSDIFTMAIQFDATNLSYDMIQASQLEIFMNVNQDVVHIGQQLIYTVILRNTSLLPLEHIHFTNVLPDALCFIEESLHIQGKFPYRHKCNNSIELHIDILNPGGILNISYRCLVEEVRDSGPIINSAEAEYYSSGLRHPIMIKNHVRSQAVLTHAYHKNIHVLASASHSYVLLGDKLFFKMVISNEGTIVASEVRLCLNLPDGLRMNKDSVQINGAIRPYVRSEHELFLGTIPAKSATIIIFYAMVEHLPHTRRFIIQSQATYQFEIPHSNERKEEITKANAVLIQMDPSLSNVCKPTDKGGIRPAKLILQFSGERSEVTLGVPYRYSVMITNIGHTCAYQVSLELFMPREARLIRVFHSSKNEVRIHKAPLSGTIQTGHIGPGETALVDYQIELFTPPASNSLIYTVMARHLMDSSFPMIRSRIYTSYSNSVLAIVYYCDIEVHTTVDKTAVEMSDTLRFRTVIRNRGTVEALHIRMNDLLSSTTLSLASESAQTNEQSSLIDVIDRLEPGQSYIWHHEAITMKPRSSTLLSNQVSLDYRYYSKELENEVQQIAAGNQVHIYIKHHALQITVRNFIQSTTCPRTWFLSISITNVGGGTACNVMLYPRFPRIMRAQVSIIKFDENISISQATANHLFIPLLRKNQTSTLEIQVVTHNKREPLSLDIKLQDIFATYYYHHSNLVGIWEHIKVSL